MAHFIRVIKGRTLKKQWHKLIKEKEKGYWQSDESDRETSGESESNAEAESINQLCSEKCYAKIKSQKSVENFFCKSFFGFLGGVLLTYLFFFFFYIGMSFSLRNVTYMCGISGVILCLGLAFSTKVRCYVFLLLPVFFSKQGRQALIAYALFLAFTGPGKNTMHNMGILSESMSCGQAMVKKTLNQIIDMIKTPIKSIKETLEKLTKDVKEVIEVLKGFVMNVKRVIISVLNVIKKATSWLGSIINLCNKKIGTPFQRCMKTFDEAIIDCRAKLGVMDFMCHIVHIVKALCYSVKWLDFICLYTEFASEKAMDEVKKKLREFNLHIKSLFYVSVDFTHTYAFETTASNSTKEITKTILQKISEKVERLEAIFSFFGFLFGFLFIFVFFKVYYYKYKYLSSDQYDNIYISKYIIELDLKRAKLNKETVLPLEPREKQTYAKPTSMRLLRTEKSRMAESVFLLTLTTFKIISFLVCDYSLFWILLTIYEAGQEGVHLVEKTKIEVHIQGNGVLANFYKRLGKTFKVPENPYMHLNPLHCLPDPVEPDTGRYWQIAFLLALSWLLALFEPYGLRLRNIVMSYYYPDRARERAVWLYNHILRCRGSFLRFARRQLRRKFHNDPRIQKVTLLQRLFSSFPVLRLFFREPEDDLCMICGAKETKNLRLKRCKTPDCPGRYCIKCFGCLQNICTICKHPIQYGDVSDISEEIDSSEEEFYKTFRTRRCSKSDDDSFKTLKDMEKRAKFKDVEANKGIDYVKLGDLYSDKAALKRRLKEALIKRLNKLEAKKNSNKTDRIREIKIKLKEIIAQLRKKKKEAPKLKSSLKKCRGTLKNDSGSENDSFLPCEPKTAGKVSFKLNNNKTVGYVKTKRDYGQLIYLIRKKVEYFRRKRRYKDLTKEV